MVDVLMNMGILRWWIFLGVGDSKTVDVLLKFGILMVDVLRKMWILRWWMF
jgi:hypothetical protein